MILIEGPDGVGKTTLAKKLQNRARCAYVHWGPLPTWWRQAHYTTQVYPFAVYDRYHWSAWAYRGVSPQPWEPSIEACTDIDKALRVRCSQRYFRILLYSSVSKFFEDNPKIDSMFNLDEIKLVNDNFHELAVSKNAHFDYVCDVSHSRWADEREILRIFETQGWPLHAGELGSPVGKA